MGQRFGIFKVNLDFIHEMNAKGNSFELGVTQFADLTADEFASTHFGIKQPEQPWGSLPSLGQHEYGGEALADAVDWTTNGAVTPVKNQGQCGSCWSFSTTGALEGAYEIASGNLVSLSEQQFVDCDKVDSGCSGGLMDNGFTFAKSNALCTEASYPYKAKADKSVFQRYKSGVLQSTCGSQLDHGVLLVGYGTEDGKDYWKVKNSWGSSWGDAGYVKLLRG